MVSVVSVLDHCLSFYFSKMAAEKGVNWKNANT